MSQATPASKTCTKCSETKSLDEFGRDKNRRDGFNPWCRVCNRANANRHRLANADAISAKRKAKYAADPDPVRQRVRQYARRNSEVVKASKRRHYQENREQRIAAMAEYRRRHPDRFAAGVKAAKAKRPEHYRMLTSARTTVRRARLAAVVQVPFTATQLAQRFAYYGNRCWMCGDPASCADHVKPIFAGGPNMLANLRPACTPCNGGKSGRWPYAPALRTRATA